MRQFEGMPNMIRMLLDAGKLPTWIESSSQQ
jgi:hypothetical protein